MRLGTSFLTLVALPLSAQARPPLPWETAPAVAWIAGVGTDSTESGPLAVPSAGPLRLSLDGDGTLRVVDAKGLRRLRIGLPGRPLRAWRDAGLPLDLAERAWNFPQDTALSKGLGTLPWAAEDFRPALRGLLWVLDDGERVLTVVHPATGRVVFLPLPEGQDFSLRMAPGYVELQEKTRGGVPRRWSLPWLALLPQFAQLARPEETPAPGTALVPFPKN